MAAGHPCRCGAAAGCGHWAALRARQGSAVAARRRQVAGLVGGARSTWWMAESRGCACAVLPGSPDGIRSWPVGADNAFTSCDLRILADEAPEPIASSNADAVVSRRDVGPAVGRFLAEGPVRPVGVVVIDIFARTWCRCRRPAMRMRSVHSRRAGDPALADRIGPRRLDWRCDDPHAGRGEDGVERVGVFGIPVSDQELQIVGALTEVHQRVPGLLYRPCGGGVGGDAGQVDAAIVMLDDEQHIEPAEEDGVDVEEVDRCDRLGLGGQELPPAVGCAPRRGVDAGGLEDLPDGGGRDLVARVPSARRRSAGSPRSGCREPFPARVGGSSGRCADVQVCGAGRSSGV